MPKGEVFTKPYVPPEPELPRPYIPPVNEELLERLRYRNMLVRGLFEFNRLTLPVCGNGHLWKPALLDSILEDEPEAWTSRRSR